MSPGLKGDKGRERGRMEGRKGTIECRVGGQGKDSKVMGEGKERRGLLGREEKDNGEIERWGRKGRMRINGERKRKGQKGKRIKWER